LRAGEVVFGCFANFPAPTIVEMCGLLGFDFVLIDCEHGSIAFPQAVHMIRAADSVGIVPFVRTPLNEPQWTMRYLDAGALGIQFPQIRTPEDAQRAVHSVKYHPLGRRGLAAARAANFGLTQPLAEYVAAANRETLVSLHIETLEAVENLPQLLDLEEVDVFFVGPTDLSHALGMPGQVQHEQVQALIQRVFREIRAAGRVAGSIAIDAEQAKRLLEAGVQYIVPGATRLFAQAVRDFFAAVRRG